MENATERNILIVPSGRIIQGVNHYGISSRVNEFLHFSPQFQLVPSHNTVEKDRMSKSKVFCSVYGCNSTYNTSNNISFHRFPKQENEPNVLITNEYGEQQCVGRILAWMLALKMEKEATRSTRVCSLHFTQDDFILTGVPAIKKRLKGTAVPTQNLPVSPQSSSDISDKRYSKRTRKKKISKKDVPLKLSDSHPYLTSILEKPQPSTICNNLEELQPKISGESENSSGDTDVMDIKTQIKTEPTTDSSYPEFFNEKQNLIKFENDVEIKSEPYENNQVETYNEEMQDVKHTGIFSSPLPFLQCGKSEEDKERKNEVYPDAMALNSELFMKNGKLDQNKQTIGITYLYSGNNNCAQDEKDKPYSCDKCNRTFTQLWYLNFHTKKCVQHHVCDGCKKSFPSARSLHLHKKKYAGESVYTCDICNKTFTTLCSLKKHIISHNNTCNICNKSFCNQRTLKFHILLHSGEKPHTCDVCKKSFLSLFNLKQHTLLHEEVNLFTCIGCNKTFACERYLRNHIARICTKLYVRMQNSTKTAERPYVCENCKASFSDVECLNVHKFIRKH